VLGLVETLFLLAASMCVGWARIYLGYHSIDQVQAGAIIGLVIGTSWVQLMSQMDSVFTLISTSALGQCINLKNTWGIPDALYLESIAHCTPLPHSLTTSKRL